MTKDFSPDVLNERRLEAVRLRLDGHTVAEVAKRTGLSAPTISAAWKAFREGGWEAVPIRQRGRPKGEGTQLGTGEHQLLWQCLADQPPAPLAAWNTRALAKAVAQATDKAPSPRTIDHWLDDQGLKPTPLALEGVERKRSTAGRWVRQQVMPIVEQINKGGGSNWQGGVRVVTQTDTTSRRYQLYLHGKRGALFTRCLASPPNADDYLAMFERLAADGPAALIFHGAFFQASPEIRRWLEQNPQMQLMAVPADAL